MARKGHTTALLIEVRRARQRRKAVARLLDLIVCVEFYYDNRSDYTPAELNSLENAIVSQRDGVQQLTA